MKRRCYNENSHDWPGYGGKGIEMSPAWRASFRTFLEDMGPRPSKDHSIDRIDPTGSYCRENCRWATATEQSNNTCRNVVVEHDGRKQTVSEWARELGVDRGAIYRRLYQGATPPQALGLVAMPSLRKPVRPRGTSSTAVPRQSVTLGPGVHARLIVMAEAEGVTLGRLLARLAEEAVSAA